MHPSIAGFFNFIYQRQAIYRLKNIIKLNPPWSDDSVFQKYKFCNVYRELDICSIHLIDKIINNPSLSLENKIFNILLYRRFNTPDFFDIYGIQPTIGFKTDELINKMDAHKLKDNNLFNSAYIISQASFISSYRKSDKHVQQILLMNNILNKFDKFQFHLLEEGGCSIEELVNALIEEMPLTGGFLAYQYAIDMSYLPELKSCFTDFNSWCDVGPGALLTIDNLFGKQKNKNEYMKKCIELYKMQKDYLKEDWNRIAYDSPYNPNPELSLNNIENCCCEYRKYINLSHGIGRKRYYKPKGE